MRKFLISLAAASALVPAAASAEDGNLVGAMRSHAERSNHQDESSDNQSRRSQPVQRVERSNDDRPMRIERAMPGNRPTGNDQVEHVERVDRGGRDARRIDRTQRTERQPQQVIEVEPPASEQRVRRMEAQRDGLAGAFSHIGQDGRSTTSEHRGDRDGGHRWSGDRHRWSGDWRRDHRYDWRNYRNRYSSLFRLGRYNDPYGWGYRRFSIGFSLYPSYYGSNYWLNDPWQYRLPPAYGPYRWVRYYDDALLVNIYSGEVVDVVYNFFW